VWAIPVLIAVCLVVLPAQAQYSGGTGEPNDPYQIATAADLIALGETPEDYDKHFLLTADIDLDPNLPGGRVFDRAVIAPDTASAQSGFQGTAFRGVFEGNGHTISHLTVQGHGYLGLFGRLVGNSGSAGQVKNLGVVDANITGTGDYVGGLVGESWGSLTHCYSTGAVSGSYDVGGLIGHNYGFVIRCYSTTSVSGDSVVGGLVGNNMGFVTRCYCGGTVSGSWYVGGLVGNNEGPWGWGPGGTVSQCYSTGAVCGHWCVGGLVGDNVGQSGPGVALGSGDGTVTQCYSTGAVSGSGSVGGLVGQNTGDWGCAGIVDGCFWDTQTSGQATSAGGTGLTTAEMQMAKTLLDAGWDFVGEVNNGTHEVWQMPEEGGYPVLAAFAGYTPRELQGTGTVEDPYLISDAMDLGAMIYYYDSAMTNPSVCWLDAECVSDFHTRPDFAVDNTCTAP